MENQNQNENQSIAEVVAGWMKGAERAAVGVVGNDTRVGSPEPRPDDAAANASAIDRLWAAAAHLGPFFGFWLLAPLVVWLVKRGGSEFARWHSWQALVLTLWSFFGIVLGVLVLGLAVLVAGLLDKLGLRDAPEYVVLVGALPVAFVVLFSVAMSAIGGLKALRGRPWTMPIIGGIARGRTK